jgi:hypothetical protein
MAKNPFLKRANETHDYTPEQIQELARCAEDAEYFIDTYCQIQHATDGTIPFTLRPYQKRIVKTFSENRLSIALAPRQIGKSWIAGAFLLWFAMFKFEKTVLILSNKNDNAMEMIHRVRFIYERLPHWIKPGLPDDGWNKHSVGFDNGSRIISQATSENSGRGLSVSLLFLDEFAFVRDNVAEEFWNSVSPTLATGGSCIICSTPNGDTNRFAQLWRGAKTKMDISSDEGINGFVPIDIKWNEPPGRDAEFMKKEKAKIGETKWLQEYECRFISNMPTLFDPIATETLTQHTENIQPVGVNGEITFYKLPASDTVYLVGMDAATGTGSDFTTIEVFEFPSLEQVAEFRSNTMSSVSAYHTLKKLISIFERQGAMIYFSVENNGVGEAIIALYEADDNPPDTAEFVSEAGQARRGMTTTGKSKMKACLAFKEMVERGGIHIKSRLLVAEMKQFVRKGQSYTANVGSSDDLIMATIIAIRMLEEIATYDQAAYDKLYSYSYFEDDNSESDGDYMPDGFVF